MLLGLGDRYQENQQYSDRTRVLERAYAESRSLDDVGLRSDAACRWASQLAERGDFAQSFKLLDEVLTPLSVRPEYAAVEAGCRVTESINASQASDSVRATRAAERALALEERRGGIPAVRREALAALGTALKNATRYDDANRVYERLIAVLEAQGLENTRDMVAVLNNWGVMLSDAGQESRAAAEAERAVRIARSLDSEHDAALTTLTNDPSHLPALRP